jgi:hypothetical protein
MPSQTVEGMRRALRPGGPPEGRGKRPLIIAGAVVVAVAIVFFLAIRGGTDKSKLSTTKSPLTTLAPSAGASGGASQAGGSAAGQGGANGSVQGSQSAAPPFKTPGMPVNISVSNTSNLKDGDVVKIHVVPQKGSVVYGFEAFLCRSGVSYELDADIRPTFTGNCVPPPRPLSAASQSYLKVLSQPPYAAADGEFRVGVGTTTYAVQGGGTATVVCGHANPCSLVLKVQYPYGFGFDTVPLTFQ